MAGTGFRWHSFGVPNRRHDLRLRHLRLHGHDVRYRMAGEGPALVFVHGLAGSSTTWQEVMPALADRYTVLAPDLLGHGESAKPRGDYSLGAYASGLRDLMVALGIERATFVGHSLGGGVALQLAYQFPERCERLVLVASGGLGKEVGAVPAGREPARQRAGDAAAAQQPGALGPRRGQRLVRPSRACASAPRPARCGGATAACRRRAAGSRSSTPCDRSSTRWGQRVSARDRLYLASEVPTLILWGDRDRIIPVEHAYAAHELIPGSTLVVLPGVGHFLPTDAPDAFVEAVETFVQATEPADATEAEFRALLLEHSASGGRLMAPGQGVDATVLAIPFYFGSMEAERRYLRRRAAEEGPSAADYERNDTMASLSMGVGSLLMPFAASALVKRVTPGRGRFGKALVGTAAVAAIATTIADRVARTQEAPDPASRSARRWARKVARVSGPVAVGTGGLALSTWVADRTSATRQWRRGEHRDLGSGPLAWGLAILGWDFIYYWNHRFMHEARGMWAIHVVHHSSERYNLSTALRQPVAEVLGVWVPYGLLARAGIRPSLIQQARGINLLYQYWIHTDAIRSIGVGEEVLNTPSHHRVHHGSNSRVHRPQPRQHPDRLGPPVRDVPARGGGGRLRPHEEHRHLLARAHRHARAPRHRPRRRRTPRPGATASPTSPAAPVGRTSATPSSRPPTPTTRTSSPPASASSASKRRPSKLDRARRRRASVEARGGAGSGRGRC